MSKIKLNWAATYLLKLAQSKLHCTPSFSRERPIQQNYFWHNLENSYVSLSFFSFVLWSSTCRVTWWWLDNAFNFGHLGTMKLCPIAKNIGVVGTKFCQSGQSSPNLVTLLPSLTLTYALQTSHVHIHSLSPSFGKQDHSLPMCHIPSMASIVRSRSAHTYSLPQ